MHLEKAMSEYKPVLHPAMRVDPCKLHRYNPKPICGIYFLFDEDEIVYIGQSRGIVGRVAEHARLSISIRVVFTSYAFIKVPETDLDLIEIFWIQRVKPKFNRNQSCPARLKTTMEMFVPKEAEKGKENAPD